jgi:hypothetical protein
MVLPVYLSLSHHGGLQQQNVMAGERSWLNDAQKLPLKAAVRYQHLYTRLTISQLPALYHKSITTYLQLHRACKYYLGTVLGTYLGTQGRQEPLAK